MGGTGDSNRVAGKPATGVLLQSWGGDWGLDLREQREKRRAVHTLPSFLAGIPGGLAVSRGCLLVAAEIREVRR